MSTRDDMDQGGDVGAEVAAVLAEHQALGGECTCGESLPVNRLDTTRWYCEHVADALAPLIAVRVEAAKAEALREAADEMFRLESKSAWDFKAARERGAHNTAYYVGKDDAFGQAGCLLRDRAAALDPGPRNEGRRQVQYDDGSWSRTEEEWRP